MIRSSSFQLVETKGASYHKQDAHDPSGHCCAQHSTESGLKQRLLFVLAASLCLMVGGATHYLRPLQPELSGLWSMSGALLAALPIVRDTIAGLQSRSSENSEFCMNQFMTLAVVACLAAGHYYTGGIIAIILLLGHILEDRGMLGASEAINSLLRLSRTRARRLVDPETEEEIDANLLAADDLVRVRPGDTIPADGTIVKGSSAVNQANITGESLPVEIAEGDNVFAGTVNLTGMMEILVTQAGNQTVLGRVRKIVEEAQATRAPIVRLTEAYASYYMPIILLVAGIVLFFTHDIQRAISVIIVSIPCAFVMAGPTAMVAALASASRLGILVKSVRFFEAANQVETVVFDKTGTLTSGQLQLIKVEAIEGEDPHLVLAKVASLEQHSTHPIAQAILSAARTVKLTLSEVTNLKETHGLGLRGMVDNEILQAGRRAWLEENGILVPSIDPKDSAVDPYSAIAVAASGKYIGTLYFSDTLRPEAKGLRAKLEKEGIEHFVMLTGDRTNVAQEVAQSVGITMFDAECLPTQKLEQVEKLKQQGRKVLVVGDGVNDAPALAAGDLSIAMGALGSDVAIQTADVALMSSDLNRVLHFLQLARVTMRTVNQNMMCGFAFIGITVLLSSAGYIAPIAAAVLHECAAFFVIFNSARLLKFEGE